MSPLFLLSVNLNNTSLEEKDPILPLNVTFRSERSTFFQLSESRNLMPWLLSQVRFSGLRFPLIRQEYDMFYE